MNRLLVVEENPELLLRMKVFLRDRYRVTCCESIADAVVTLDRVEPHLILLGVTRRPAAAIDFLRVFREFPKYRAIPVLAMMECPGEDDIRAFLAAGFRGVISRPASDPFPLYGAIDHFLSSGGRVGVRQPGPPGFGMTATEVPA